METFQDREHKVLNFIDKVKELKTQEELDNSFKNSTDYKLKCLKNEQNKAKGVCLDMVFSKLYKDALPLNDDYKVANGEDLDADMGDFINTRCPKGLEYYVKEAIKKGSAPARKIMEAVEKMIEDDYTDKALNIEDVDAKDLVFNTDQDVQKKIDVMNKDLGIDDITQIIHDNVKTSAASEIMRAKQEKENTKNLEAELANDMNITNEQAIDDYLLLKGYTEKKDFQPTLFQGIMIGKLNTIQQLQESSNFEPTYLYDTLSDYGMYESVEEVGTHFATPEELAFVESVKEFTKINVIKALKLENFDKYSVRRMADKYAYNI